MLPPFLAEAVSDRHFLWEQTAAILRTLLRYRGLLRGMCLQDFTIARYNIHLANSSVTAEAEGVSYA